MIQSSENSVLLLFFLIHQFLMLVMCCSVCIGTSDAVIPYEDFSLLSQLAKESGCDIDQYKQKASVITYKLVKRS